MWLLERRHGLRLHTFVHFYVNAWYVFLFSILYILSLLWLWDTMFWHRLTWNHLLKNLPFLLDFYHSCWWLDYSHTANLQCSMFSLYTFIFDNWVKYKGGVMSKLAYCVAKHFNIVKTYHYISSWRSQIAQLYVLTILCCIAVTDLQNVQGSTHKMTIDMAACYKTSCNTWYCCDL